MKSCATCRFAYKLGEFRKNECRRHPPVAFGPTTPNYRQWPIVYDDDWCGEWGTDDIMQTMVKVQISAEELEALQSK